MKFRLMKIPHLILLKCPERNPLRRGGEHEMFFVTNVGYKCNPTVTNVTRLVTNITRLVTNVTQRLQM